MKFVEDEHNELKEIYTEELKKEILAFANTDGGKIYIGVSDEGEIIGINDANSTSLKISNMVRDAIKPDLTMFIKYEILNVKNKEIIQIDVQRGTSRPYYIAKKGMRPEGVYVRQNTYSVNASEIAIRRMIKETDGDKFEEGRSFNQNLTFNYTEKEFSERQLAFTTNQQKTLKVIDQNGLYTNLALLLSDQSTYDIKVGHFEGLQPLNFKDRKQFQGSVFEQLNNVYNYLNLRNEIPSTINGLYRNDRVSYPDIAIREALLNLIIHRDYSINASSLIYMFDDRIEFMNFGTLPQGIDIKDFEAGISICRNQNLANIFFRLELIEAYGTGMVKIFDSYKESSVQPRILVTPNTFKIILPNLNYTNSSSKQNVIKITNDTNQVLPTNKKDDAITQVLNFAKTNFKFEVKDIAILLKVSESTAYRLIKKLVEAGKLKKEGSARSTKYFIN